MTITSWPGRDGLGKTYMSAMSMAGSATARALELWSVMADPSGRNRNRQEGRFLHDAGCDLVDRVVGKEACAAATILNVDGGHQGSLLRGVVRGPLAGGVHPGDRMGAGLRHEGLGVLVRLCRHI